MADAMRVASRKDAPIGLAAQEVVDDHAALAGLDIGIVEIELLDRCHAAGGIEHKAGVIPFDRREIRVWHKRDAEVIAGEFEGDAGEIVVKSRKLKISAPEIPFMSGGFFST